MALDSNLSQSVRKKLGRASHFEGRRLSQPSIILDLTGREGYLKADFL
jgi:hypothetical protein